MCEVRLVKKDNFKFLKLKNSRRDSYCLFLIVFTITLAPFCASFGIEKEKIIKNDDSKIFNDLNKHDKSIWNRGEISNASYIGGAVLGTVVGFGSGHGVQRRFVERGAYFAVAEAAAWGVLFSGGFFTCLSGDSVDLSNWRCQTVTGAAKIIFVGAKIWEIYDLWFIPPADNARYRELKNIHKTSKVTFSPTLLPIAQNGIAVGLLINF